jgi:hypothetical protein
VTLSNQQYLRLDGFRRSRWLHILHRHEEPSRATKIDRGQQKSLQIWVKAVGHSQPFGNSDWTWPVQNVQLSSRARRLPLAVSSKHPHDKHQSFSHDSFHVSGKDFALLRHQHCISPIPSLVRMLAMINAKFYQRFVSSREKSLSGGVRAS